MRVTIVGSGDAFGTGGRHQPCFLVEDAGFTLMLDCGATTTSALERLRRDPNTIPAVLISHLHGDHFGGVIFMVVQALFSTKRTAPFVVYGPPGIEARYRATMDLLYPGFLALPLPFALTFVEVVAGIPTMIGPLRIVATTVDHPSGAPSLGFRIESRTRTLAYTGDTRWTEALIALGRATDLYLMECYAPEATPAAHLTWRIIRNRLDDIGAKRIVLTHMNREMLARRGEVDDPRVVCAEDGMVIEL